MISPVGRCRYVAWICRAEDLVLAEERTTEADRVKIMEARQKSMEKMKKLYGTKPNKKESVETNSDAAVEEEGSFPYLARLPISVCFRPLA